MTASSTLVDRLSAQVTRLGPNECWLWTGGVDRDGYGRLRDGKRYPSVHRLAYELAHGSIQVDLLVDHTCHNSDDTCAGGVDCRHRRCCNPRHMELVSIGENVRRGRVARTDAPECRRGHLWTPENTAWRDWRGTRYRVCRACQKEGARRFKEKRLAAA